MQAPVAHGRRAARVAIVDEHAEARAEHRERHAQLETIAAGARLPDAAYARLELRELLAVFAGLDVTRRDRARAGRRDEHLALVAVRVLKAKPDAVAHAARIERARTGRIEHRVCVAYVDQQVEHALVHTGKHTEAVGGVLLVPGPGGRVSRPVFGVTIDERRRG